MEDDIEPSGPPPMLEVDSLHVDMDSVPIVLDDGLGDQVNGDSLHAVPPPPSGQATLPLPASVQLQPSLPSFTEDAAKFVSRMADMGFCRSKTQMFTEADGNCFFHALVDQVISSILNILKKLSMKCLMTRLLFYNLHYGQYIIGNC